MIGKSDEGFSVHIHMVEVDGLLVNPPKEKILTLPYPLVGDVAFVVIFKVAILPPTADPLKGSG
jgi:hypothetical protein